MKNVILPTMSAPLHKVECHSPAFMRVPNTPHLPLHLHTFFSYILSHTSLAFKFPIYIFYIQTFFYIHIFYHIHFPTYIHFFYIHFPTCQCMYVTLSTYIRMYVAYNIFFKDLCMYAAHTKENGCMYDTGFNPCRLSFGEIL